MTAALLLLLLARLAWEAGAFWPRRLWCLARHRDGWLGHLVDYGGVTRCPVCSRVWSARPLRRFLRRADALDAFLEA